MNNFIILISISIGLNFLFLFSLFIISRRLRRIERRISRVQKFVYKAREGGRNNGSSLRSGAKSVR